MSVAMLPAAPGRLSTITCCPSLSLSLGVSARAVVSVPPPGAKPTIMRIGFVGYALLSAANAPAQNDASASVATGKAQVERMFMVSSWSLVNGFGATAEASGCYIMGSWLLRRRRSFQLALSLAARARLAQRCGLS